MLPETVSSRRRSHGARDGSARKALMPTHSAACIPLNVVLTSPDRPDMRLDAELLLLGDHFLELAAPIALSEGINVDVAVGRDIINTRVISCTRDRHPHMLRLGFNADRRRHARIAVGKPAIIRGLHPQGSQQDVTIIDVSPG